MFFILLEFKQPIHINFTTKFGSHYQKKKRKHFSCLHHHNTMIPRFLHIPPPTSFHKPLTHPHVPKKTFLFTQNTSTPHSFGKKTETAATMSSDPSLNSTDTTISLDAWAESTNTNVSSNSSSVTSKASLK